jgi:hypothetical protein
MFTELCPSDLRDCVLQRDKRAAGAGRCGSRISPTLLVKLVSAIGHLNFNLPEPKEPMGSLDQPRSEFTQTRAYEGRCNHRWGNVHGADAKKNFTSRE